MIEALGPAWRSSPGRTFALLPIAAADERRLAERFGPDWDTYRGNVPRWPPD
ncbi:MAG TPA: hypothetical protein VIM50_02060 [Candidatus Limnocylindria bacterium]